MRPGRGLKSSSRVVMTGSERAEAMDGGRKVEIVAVSCKSASGAHGPDGQNLQSDQTLAPGRRRRFYLAVLIGVAFLFAAIFLSCKRPVSARFRRYALAVHIGLLRMLEDLRWGRNVTG